MKTKWKPHPKMKNNRNIIILNIVTGFIHNLHTHRKVFFLYLADITVLLASP